MMALKDVTFDNIGVWIPQDGVKYYWKSFDQGWCVVAQIDTYGRRIYIRTPNFKTTVILPDVSWFRSMRVVADPMVKYENGLLDTAICD